jgi:hypothetical protein
VSSSRRVAVLVADKHTDPAQLRRSHIVITSYSVVASEYANYIPDGDEDKRQVKGKKEKNAYSSSDSDSMDDSDESDESGGPTDRRLMKAIGSKKKAIRRATSGVKDALFRVKWWRIVLGKNAPPCRE